MKKYLFTITGILFAHYLSAQNAISTNMPKIIPASPTAQTFMRYGEIPVDYSTGVPSISIPLYTLEGRKLSVPISISYHASGIKVNDVASEVGLGWSLNAGGIVSRSVNDIRDEGRSGIRSYANADALLSAIVSAAVYDTSCQCYVNLENFEMYFNTSNNNEDLMSDRYFYKLPNGSSGTFTYDYPNEANVITMPYRPYKFQRFVSGTYPNKKLDSIKITDDNGTVYTFEYYLASTVLNRSEWLLKSMVSADGTDTITFNYTDQPANYTILNEANTWYGTKQYVEEPCTAESDTYSFLTSGANPSPNFGTPVLTSITSSTATVTFTYASRQDYTGLQRLSKITVTPVNSSTALKVVDFNQFYFGTTAANKRLGLEKVIVSAPGATQNEQYSFTYDSMVLPAYHNKDTSSGYSEDLWGYYKGLPSNSLVPKDFISTSSDQQLYGANRDGDSGYYARACMLKSIKYPTGGRTEFTFERHYTPSGLYPYRSTNTGGYLGGFRVGSITNYTVDNEIANIKTYQYSNPSFRPVTQEFFKYEMRTQDFKTYTNSEGWQNSCFVVSDREILSSNPFHPLEIAPGLPVMYGEVTEYNGTVSDNAGKTVYNYNVPIFPLPTDGIMYYHPNFEDQGNYIPELASKTVYAKNGTSTYKEVSKEVNTYTDQFATEFTTGMKVTRTISFARTPTATPPSPITAADYYQSIIVKSTKAIQQASLLSNTKIYTYDQVDTTKYTLSSTDFTYYQQNLRVSERSTVSTNGDILKTTYKYTPNFPSQAPYTTMLTKNRLNELIEQNDYKGSELLATLKQTYRNWSGNIFEPEFIQASKGSGLLENRINFLSYDTFGNPTSLKKVDGTPVCYVYSYNNKYPVAEVINADYATVVSALGGATAVNSFGASTTLTDSQVTSFLVPLRGSSSLASAMVTTLTYKPLTGATTITDPKGYTLFYEYDAFGRLKSIKDKDSQGNYRILSENEYNYKPY